MKKPIQEFTHLDKIFWPREAYTKGDMVEYYRRIAPYMLPYLEDRPISLNRYPEGIGGSHFFQKNFSQKGLPGFVATAIVRAKTTGKDVRYVICNNAQTLLYLANLGCIEIHPWNSRKKSLEKPDYIIFDLDPGPKSSFNDVIKTARTLHEVLDARHIENLCKTSGKRGLHVYVPAHRKYTYDEAQKFARVVAEEVSGRLPKVASLEHWPRDRKEKVYIDIMRNAIGQTTVAPYSLRPVPGATVSTPLRWSEVKTGLRAEAFNLKTIFKRLGSKGDAWHQ